MNEDMKQDSNVVIFECHTPEDLERKINAWIDNKKYYVTDIKYSVGVDDEHVYHCAMLIYEAGDE